MWLTGVVAVVAGGGWWYLRSADGANGPDPEAENVREEPTDVARSARTVEGPATLTSSEQIPEPGPVRVLVPADDADTESPGAIALGGSEEPAGAVASDKDNVRAGDARIEAARALLKDGKVVAARQALAALLKQPLDQADRDDVRTLLRQIADETIFGQRNIPDDPCVMNYTVESGDRLVNVTPRYGVPHEIVMRINGIRDETRVRAGQRLKIPRGPFHLTIDKSDFRMDVFLGDIYVRSYRVGLGTEGGTPEGVWRVKNRLVNPTYYPPASAANKRIIPPGDPTNPLGKRWIGLEGIKGDAIGREGYGIHGTIEPESIGKAVSLGCVRMHNEDVEFVYALLLPGQSTVTIVP